MAIETGSGADAPVPGTTDPESVDDATAATGPDTAAPSNAADGPDRSSPLAFRVGLALITALAAGIRLITLRTVAKRDPSGFGDPAFYHLQANMLVKGLGFSEPFRYYFLHQRPAIPSASHPPLYSLWLAIPSAVGLNTWTDHKLMSCLAGTLTVLVVGLVGREIAGWRAGLIAALLTACYPNLWMIDGILMPEGLFTLTMVITIGCAYRWWRTARVGWALGLGAAIALAALTRGEAIMLLVVLVVPLLWRRPGLDWRRRLEHLALVGVAAGLLLAPWMIRNSMRFHHFVPLSNNSNEVIYYANCPDSYYGPTTGFWSFNCQVKDRAAHAGGGFPGVGRDGDPLGDESDKALYWRKKGIQYAMDHKSRALVVAAVRVGRIWDVYAPFQNAWFTKTEGRSVRVSNAGVIVYWLLWPFAIFGAVVLHRRRVTLIPMIAMAVMVTLTGLYAYGAVRFRTPVDLALLMLAGAGIDALVRRRAKSEPSYDQGQPTEVPS